MYVCVHNPGLVLWSLFFMRSQCYKESSLLSKVCSAIYTISLPYWWRTTLSLGQLYIIFLVLPSPSVCPSDAINLLKVSRELSVQEMLSNYQWYDDMLSKLKTTAGVTGHVCACIRVYAHACGYVCACIWVSAQRWYSTDFFCLFLLVIL